jgi:alpha-tubulin suppressor-like RCC1 family protein
MNRFWGRNDDELLQKFSRDDEQILALNYENTCDGDYLNRLFVLESNIASSTPLTNDPALHHSVQASASTSQKDQSNISQSNNSDGWTLSPDISEDVVIFGKEAKLGREFFHKRYFGGEIVTLCKYQDSLSTLINRQSLVFEHIGRLMLDRCNTAPVSIKSDSINTSSNSMKRHVVSDVLLCSLKAFEKQSRVLIKQSIVEPLVSLLVNIYHQSNALNNEVVNNDNDEIKNKKSIENQKFNPLNENQLHYLRALLCNGTTQGIGMCSLKKSNYNGKTIEEGLRLSLLCTYGLLILGITTKSSGDVIISISHLMTISILSDEWKNFLLSEQSNLPIETTVQPISVIPTTNNNPITDKALPHNLNHKLRLKSKKSSDNKIMGIKQQLSTPIHLPDDNTLDNRDRIDLKEESRFSIESNAKLPIQIKSWEQSKNKNMPLEKDSKLKVHHIVKSKSTYDYDESNLILPQTVLVGRVGVGSKQNKNQKPIPKALLFEDPVFLKQQQHNQQYIGNQSKSITSPSLQMKKDTNERDLRKVMKTLLRIPKSVLNIVQECSKNLSINKNDSTPSSNFMSNIVKSYVWSSGQNSYGELGLGDVNQRKSFNKINFFEGKCIVSVGSGNEHSVFVTKEGKMFVSGYNDNGQCGIGSTQQVRQPLFISALDGEEITQAHVYNGCEHTLGITRDGKLYSFGYNYRGQLGLGSTNSEATPRLVKSLLSRKVVLAACSYHHSIILCSDGTLFSMGRNDCGQLGHGDNIDKKTPQPVLISPKDMKTISCGQFHTVVSTTAGTAYVCGKNDYGQLGLESPDIVKVLTKLTGSSEVDNVKQICCGYYHTLILSHNGAVTGFGRNDYGQLGLGHTQPRVYGCHLINILRDKNIINISSGCYHSIAATLNGMLYVFGRNNHGQLGTGDLDERHLPHPVDDFIGRRILSVAAGFYHTIVLAVDSLGDGSDEPGDNIIMKSSTICSSLLEPQVYKINNDNHSTNNPAVEEDSPNTDAINPSKSLLGSTSENPPSIEPTQLNSSKQKEKSPPSAIPFSLDFRSKFSIYELLNHLTTQLHSFTCFPAPVSAESDNQSSVEIKKFELSWIYRQLNSITSILSLIKLFLSESHHCIEFPLSHQDSFYLLRTLIRMVENFMKTHSAQLIYDLNNVDENAVNENIMDMLLTPPKKSTLTSIDIIKEIHSFSNSLFRSEDGSNQDNNENKYNCISRLRQELFFVYLFSSLDENDTEYVQSIIQGSASCISNCFDVLFYTPELRGQFFILFGKHLTSIQSVRPGEPVNFTGLVDKTGLKNVDAERILRLYTRVCFKYRSNNEIIKLFQSSRSQGLVIFHSLLLVYSHLSLLCLDSKAQQHILVPGGDVSRALGALEHCNSNFVKCAIPIIFSTRSVSNSKEDEELVLFGKSILKDIFNSAEVVLDQISHLPLTLDLMNVLRSNTVIPGILPTILLYGISHATKFTDCVEDLLPHVDSLVNKLHQVGKIDVDGNVLTPPKVPILAKNSSIETLESVTTTSEVDSTVIPEEPPVVATPVVDTTTTSVNKNSLQVPWWSRLCKLAVILNSKLATSLIIGQSIKHNGEERKNVQNITDNLLWKYLSGPVQLSNDNLLNTSFISNKVIVSLLEKLRLNEVKTDHTYRVLTIASKSSASNTSTLFENIESMIFEVYFHILPFNSNEYCIKDPRVRNGWKEIVNFSKSIQSKKSQMISNSNGLGWKDILTIIHKLVKECKDFLLSCQTRVNLYCSLPVVNIKKDSQSRHALNAFRRCVFLVICTNRWRKCRKYKMKSIGTVIKNFFTTYISQATSNFKDFSIDKIESNINLFTSAIYNSTKIISKCSRGINILQKLLVETNSASTKCDILTTIISTMSLRSSDESTSTTPYAMWMQKSVKFEICCSSYSRIEMNLIFAKLVRHIVSYITELVSKLQLNPSTFLISSSEFNVLSLSIQFIHLLCLQSLESVLVYFNIAILQTLFIQLDDKPYGENISVDEKVINDLSNSNLLNKKNNPRERNKAIRRASNSIISLFQELSVKESSDGIDCRQNISVQLLDIHCDLIVNLQKSRSNATIRNNVDVEMIRQSKDGKELISGGKISKDGGKRRCQELITKPMEFCRQQEGFVVQGDKLLNNYKGIDFTLSTWILISKNSSNRHSFITGKISHNDAWPLIALRGDRKIEVIYGHGNEFERVTSQVSIPLFIWTHIAIVLEPKKVKVFINGVLDSHMITKGNARAVLYPVVIGSCPQGVRTRVDHVRDGFDGFLAQYKYYTRALSPIHVRIVFDQGPPDSFDVREKWIYKLFASSVFLVNSFNHFNNQIDILQKTVDTMLYLFVKDTCSRLRCSSLIILEKILISDIVKDINISSNVISSSNAGKVYPPTSICTCTFLSKITGGFKEKFVSYVLMLIGSCWLPSLTAAAEDSSIAETVEHNNLFGKDESIDSNSFLDFLAYAPIFISDKASRPSSSSLHLPVGSVVVDTLQAREESAGELCYHLTSLLRNLMAVPSWNSSITNVVDDILSKQRLDVDINIENSQLNRTSLLGTSVFLGESTSGPFVGTNVSNYYGDANGRVLNINKTTGHAAILSWNNAGLKHQIMIVRITDLSGSYIPMTSNLSNQLICTIVDSMDHLRRHIHLPLSDIFSIYRPDHPFPRVTLLRMFRPIEVFLFHQLLRCVGRVDQSGDRSTGLAIAVAIRSKPNLLISLQLAASRTMRLHSIAEESSFEKSIPSFWIKSCRYIHTMITGRVIQVEFPSSDIERTLLDYMSKFLGVAVESFQGTSHDRLLKQGLLSELVYSVSTSGNSSNQGESESAILTRYGIEEKFLINDWLTNVTGNINTNLSFSEVNDADAVNTLRLMYHLRRRIIVCSRQLFAGLNILDVETFSSIPLPSKLVLWHAVSSSQLSRPLAYSGDERSMLLSLCNNLHTKHRAEVTQSVASSLRYTAISLLQTGSSKSTGNILEATDVFNRLLQAAHGWIDYHDNEESECELCFQFLKMLLPSLSFVESSEVELQMMQLCRRSLRILCYRLLGGQVASKELMDLAKSNNFTLLRARAQEQLTRQKGNCRFQFSPLAHNLTQLAAGLEIIQHCGSIISNDISKINPIAVTNPSTKTPPPRIVGIRSTSVDADLYKCISIAVVTKEFELLNTSLEGLNKSEISSPSGNASPTNIPTLSLDGIAVEVAIAVVVVVESDELFFETVYCGNSLRFVQSGLSPSCSYYMKCRTIVNGVALEWSQNVEFRTESGIPFTFDALKCGPDIILSDDGLTASYAGDDCWSTLLGTQPYSSGITSWEIRITQSSTAYIFVGVASSVADLNSFLGGCSAGWGFIGEQALYHNREKVKVYGESFTAGDVIGVILDLFHGTLSFSRNGKILGIAFDKIYGELFPAVAFYNVGQELEIVVDSFNTTCPQEPIPCSPSRLNMDEISTLTEMIFCINSRSSLSNRVLSTIADHCTDWCSGSQTRRKAVSGKNIFIVNKSPILNRYGLHVGDRVRTPYGIAEVSGTAFDRLWFKINSSKDVWFFSHQQIQSGLEKGFFARCTYEDNISNSDINNINIDNKEDNIQQQNNSNFSKIATKDAIYDVSTIQELLEPDRWSDEMDSVLVTFLIKTAESIGVSPWNVPAELIYEDFRSLQQQLSRLVMNNQLLSIKWGISGPKRRAVIARLGFLRLFNHNLDHYLPAMMLDVAWDGSYAFERRQPDDFSPIIQTISSKSVETIAEEVIPVDVDAWAIKSEGSFTSSTLSVSNFNSNIAQNMTNCPNISLSWEQDVSSKSMSYGLLPTTRHRIFTELKMVHFWELITRSAARAAKTEDDYDYPEDLPQIKINRLKSFRAKEASELLGIPGEDLMLTSMFCQLWRELRRHPPEKLRISYTHPMDDGQSRTFKIRFEGEGVDDYGGPYREIFQQMCDELQCSDPSVEGGDNERPSSWNNSSSNTNQSSSDKEHPPVKCFLPLLHPTPNWSAGECTERYRYTFNPSSTSPIRMDLYRFLGQLVGIAIRSKVTLDLSFPSFIWKIIVRDQLTELDIASFDSPACDFVRHLGSLCHRIHMTNEEYDTFKGESLTNAERQKERDNLIIETKMLLDDLTWTAVRCDGRIVELVSGGALKPVLFEDLRLYLKYYVTCRLRESIVAIEAFREGLISVIPESAISLLCWDELQYVVSGGRTIDVERLRDNTEYDDDVSAEDEHIIMFWEILADEFTEEEKSAFLRFVWARSTLPPKGIEFPQKFKIQSAVGDDASLKPDMYLPKAHTCFFSVNLPKYSTKQVMAEKIRYAIKFCTEMDAGKNIIIIFILLLYILIFYLYILQILD